MGNMQVLLIMANIYNNLRFNPNMQYPHMETKSFVIEMNPFF